MTAAHYDSRANRVHTNIHTLAHATQVAPYHLSNHIRLLLPTSSRTHTVMMLTSAARCGRAERSSEASVLWSLPPRLLSDSYVNGSHMGVINELCCDKTIDKSYSHMITLVCGVTKGASLSVIVALSDVIYHKWVIRVLKFNKFHHFSNDVSDATALSILQHTLCIPCTCIFFFAWAH